MTDSTNPARRRSPLQFGLGVLMLAATIASSFMAGLFWQPKIDLERSSALNVSTIQLRSTIGETSLRNGIQLFSTKIGADDGLAVGQHGVVIRGDDEIAIVMVLKLESDSCAAQVIRNLRNGSQISPGDFVEFTLVE